MGMRPWIPATLAIGLLAAAPAGAATAWAQSPPATEAPLETGQRITLDLKGVDILDVLKLFSQKSGLNFVAGRNVTGRVTIFVNDVDVWDAFELIIGANDLAYERRSNIVTVMMARDYELLYGEKFQERTQSVALPLRYAKVVQVATVLNQIKSAVGRVVADEATNTLVLTDVPVRLHEMQELLTQLDRPTDTRIYSLNYADAEKLKEKVQEMLSLVGTFTFDARTNRVVISDLTEVLQKTDRLIRAFDAPDAQVLIEAKILKVDLTDEMDLGIDWQQVLSGIDVDARTNFRVLSDIIGGTATGAALKLLTAPKNHTQLIIEALKKITKTDTLSNPRIMVSNNQEAKILVGTKEAVVTVTTTVPAAGSTVSSPSIQYVDVGTKLFVTPSIKRDGHIQMKIRPEVSSSKVETFQTNRIPIVTSTEAETNVLVKSGVTLIIGGLIETKTERTDNRLPLISDIPLLGMAFRGTTDIKRKTELVVFLTPQITNPDGSLFTVPEGGGAWPGELSAEQQPLLPPASYRQAIRQRLQELLAAQLRALAVRKGSVTVSFLLYKDGRVVGDPDITTTDGKTFLLAARSALAAAQPFPPFPPDAGSDEVRFRLTVEYEP